MDVAVSFHLRGKSTGLHDKVQQFNIFYDVLKDDLNKLIEFIQAYPDKQINIEYRNGIDTKSAAALAKIGENVRFRLRAEDISKIATLQKNECKYFYDISMACGGWMDLYEQVINDKVQEVYICNDLCYELDKVRFFCDKYKVSIRMLINRLPISRPAAQDMYFIPIYRPQDMNILEQYIDVIEFAVQEDNRNTHEFEVLYKIYMEDRDWYGTLNELNPEIPFEVHCRGVIPYLAYKRSVCGLKCLRGSTCTMCKQVLKTADALKNIGAQLNN